MSDGNFNRSMLPYNNYQSGLRAGRAQMKTIALEAFEQMVSELLPNVDEEERKRLHDQFKSALEK